MSLRGAQRRGNPWLALSNKVSTQLDCFAGARNDVVDIRA